MKHNIAVNRQLFNVKSYASKVQLDNLTEGSFGIFPVNGTASIPLNTTFANLPEEFHIVSVLNDKTYHSIENISKKDMLNQKATPIASASENIWKATINSCHCIKTAVLKVGLEEDNLMRERGLSWSTSDRHVVTMPSEMGCEDCGENKVYANNLITREMYRKVVGSNPSYYTAYVEDESGKSLADLAAIDAFILANKTVNTDEDEANDGKRLVLFIKGLPMKRTPFNAFPQNYIFPRGVMLSPSIMINETEPVLFTPVQDVKFEIGAGCDLRADEFEAMNYHTDLNHKMQLIDGQPNEDITFQFENKLNYNTLSFDYFKPKVNSNDGDKRSFGITLGTESTSIYNALKSMLIP